MAIPGFPTFVARQRAELTRELFVGVLPALCIGLDGAAVPTEIVKAALELAKAGAEALYPVMPEERVGKDT